ncbi:type II toxin-antitoxin system VapC family toxin [Saccharothrix sp. Mg75]|uniref:type II toxin-antitoxin system VapC family toxin n=1 Tax=Saccharothrix sp. Mg75 TaxID=3445357 RepID=UPI003EEAC8ED
MTDTIVVDSSALLEVVAAKAPDRALLHRLVNSVQLAPALLDAEAISVLRRLERRELLSSEQATRAFHHIRTAPVERVPLRPLADRAWALRQSVFTNDAFYLALAEHLKVPFVTCDAKVLGSNGHQVDIEVYPVS